MPVRAVLTVILLLLACPTLTLARPPHKQALIDLLGDALPAKLRDCRTCHAPLPPGADESDRPHNAFGARLAALRSTLRKAGKKNDITTRLLAVLEEDSDRDGVANGIELLAGHSPGEADDRPAASAVALAKERLARWQAARRDRYTWQPFEPIRRPAVPEAIGSRNAIDAFLAVERSKRQLTPRPAAPKHLLLRRVMLDLVGLPPTPEEVEAFVRDERPDAYERLVDRLLASPRHGERWGRHWMDIWRYSDWAGYGAEVRDSQKHIWHWRDWIIDAVNADKPYDRMIQEMLAADELAPQDMDALRATGFLVRNWYKFNRNVWLDRIVEHSGKAFLGMTFNCARCHDHFYDPFTQKDYFALRAIFEPHQVRTDRVPGVASIDVDGLPRVYDAQPLAPTYLFVRGDEARPDKSKVIAPGVPAALGGSLDVRAVALPREAYQPERRAFVIRDALATAETAVQQARQAASRARRQTVLVPPLGAPSLAVAAWAVAGQKPAGELAVALGEETLAVARQKALVAVLEAERLEDAGKANTPEGQQAARKAAQAQRSASLAEAQRNLDQAELAGWQAAPRMRAAAGKRLQTARQQWIRLLAEAKKPLPSSYTRRATTAYPPTSSGRRLALARWITSRENPLAARVAVNHVWLRHFGQGIIATEFDFGRNGQPPTHPALLDWLAAEFMESGWSLKHLHRLIVTSAAYRMDSTAHAEMLARDADNRYLWRMNPRRMEGEIVRDSLLACAGRLDGTMGGADLDHKLGLSVPRRSVYFRHAAEKQMEFLGLFDAANVNECYRRSESIVPQQALALANSTLALAMSRLLAAELTHRVGMGNDTEVAFIDSAYARVLQRHPTSAERAVCRDFLGRQSKLLTERSRLTPFDSGPASNVAPSADPVQRARENLVHVLMNHHEFVTIR